MKKYITALLFLAFVPVLRADFADLGAGARQQGLGNAFTGIAEGAFGAYYNPGGLGFLSRGEFAVDYSRFHLGLGDSSNISNSFIAAAFPLEITRYKHKTKKYGTVGLGISNFSLDSTYQENAFYLSYGKLISGRLSAGGNLKFLGESYQQDAYTAIDPVFALGTKGSVSAVSVDAGILYNFMPRLFAGLAILNLNQPNVGLRTAENLPMAIRTGVGYNEKKLKVGVDMVMQGGAAPDNSINTGCEAEFFKGKVFLRTGLEIGSRDFKRISFGGSYYMKTVMLDYAFCLPLSGVQATAGSHRFTIVYRFGRIPKDEVVPGSMEEAYYQLQDEAKQLQEKLDTTEAERQKLEKVLVDEAVERAKEKIREIRVSSEERPARRQEYSGTANLAHTVAAEDTLQNLAQKYYGNQNRWMEIFNENKDKVGRGGSLIVGQVLVIPGVTKSRPAEPRPAQSAPAETQAQPPVPEVQQRPPEPPVQPAVQQPVQPPAQDAQKKYTVKEGDTLPKISQEFYGNPARWVDIYKANKGQIPKGKVEPGQVLVIP